MKVRRAIKWGIIFFVAGLLLVGELLYYQSTRTPEGYPPPKLTAQQRQEAARHFIDDKVIREFGNKAQERQPYEWTLTQDDANRELASMDEIAYQLGGKEDQVSQAMERAALASPAVTFSDDRLTLMIYSTKYEKVLSASLKFEFTADRNVRVLLDGVRVGRLPVPMWAARERLRQAIEKVTGNGQSGQDPSPASAGGLSSRDMGKVMIAILAAVDGEPIRPEVTWPAGEKHVRIESISLTGGKLTLKLQPVDR